MTRLASPRLLAFLTRVCGVVGARVVTRDGSSRVWWTISGALRPTGIGVWLRVAH